MKNNNAVVPYSLEWPEMFSSEAELIKQALGNNCTTIHHIGSTSVPGLSAKPIIDMLPVVRDIQEVDKATKTMESLGYEAKGEYGIAFRRYFQKDKNTRTHNVHVYQEGDPEISRYLKFRDWMRSHPDDAENYAKLKEELAAKFPQNVLQYCNGKDAFVASIDAKDGFDGWRVVQALTDREWSAVRNLRLQYFFKSKEDPYTWTFEHKDHIHFVFYKNAEIIGYAHLHLWPEHRAALRIIVIDEHYRNLGLGGQFLKLCERWLSHQGFKKLLVQSSQKAYKFYCNHEYVQMPFNDPDGYEKDSQDIEMGKFLMTQRDRPKISIHFELLRKAQEEMVKRWLCQDYVSEFWHGEGLQNTFKSISRFVKGEEALYTLWIAYERLTPFGYLMTSKVDLEKDHLYAKHLSPKSKAITLDLLIGDTSYLGRGLSHQMIKEFLLRKYSDITDVFIDPGTNNSKAIHVYEKAGFQKLEEFLPEWDPSHPCLLMHLKMEKLKCTH